MIRGSWALVAALAMVTTSVAGALTTTAPGINTPPTAQHPDRLFEDADGDGQVTIRLEDFRSVDPDHVHEDDRGAHCAPLGTPGISHNGIESHMWYNTTGLDGSEPLDSLRDRFLSYGQRSQPLTFGIGTYEIGLQVTDICEASGWTNFTVEIHPRPVQLYAFDASEETPELETSGLWQVTETCQGIGAQAPWLAYTEHDRDDPLSSRDCDHGSVTGTDGSATLAAIPLTEGMGDSGTSWGRLAVSFDHYFDVETSSLTDEHRMVFEASFDGGRTWIGSNHTDAGCSGERDDEGRNCWDDDSDSEGWNTETTIFDLRATGHDGEVHLRWTFNATSLSGDDRKGWFVDNVEIYGLTEGHTP